MTSRLSGLKTGNFENSITNDHQYLTFLKNCLREKNLVTDYRTLALTTALIENVL